MENPQEYYRQHGAMTSMNAHADEFSTLPRSVAALCEVIQGVLIHQDLASLRLWRGSFRRTKPGTA